MNLLTRNCKSGRIYINLEWIVGLVVLAGVLFAGRYYYLARVAADKQAKADAQLEQERQEKRAKERIAEKAKREAERKEELAKQEALEAENAEANKKALEAQAKQAEIERADQEHAKLEREYNEKLEELIKAGVLKSRDDAAKNDAMPTLVNTLANVEKKKLDLIASIKEHRKDILEIKSSLEKIYKQYREDFGLPEKEEVSDVEKWLKSDKSEHLRNAARYEALTRELRSAQNALSLEQRELAQIDGQIAEARKNLAAGHVPEQVAEKPKNQVPIDEAAARKENRFRRMIYKKDGSKVAGQILVYIGKDIHYKGDDNDWHVISEADVDKVK